MILFTLIVFFEESQLLAIVSEGNNDSTQINVQAISVGILRKQKVNGPSSALLRHFNNTATGDSKDQFIDLQFSGYVRAFSTYRNLKKNYVSGGAPTSKAIILNGVYPDDPISNGLTTGYREPLLMLEMSGKPTVNTSFQIDYILDNQMTGQIFDSTSRRIQSYRYLNLKGSIATDIGRYDLAVGGVIFTTLTPFTMWNYIFRDDMFERYPWEWYGKSYNRYNSFYQFNDISRDSRFGNGTLQGFSVEGSNMPYRTGMKLLYGKTNNVGGFQSYLNNNYQYIVATQLSKKFSRHLFSLNYFNQKEFIDNIKDKKDPSNITQLNIATAELNLSFKKINISNEFGTGSLINPIDSIRKWDPFVVSQIKLTKNLLPVPVSLQPYYIGANVVNINSAIVNSSNANVQGQFGQEERYNLNVFQGIVTELGQLTNNRYGLNLNTGYDIKKLKIGFGLGIAEEIENRFNLITFQHRLNAISRSQFIFYRNQLGPYQRQMNTWRRSWEKISIMDTIQDYKKGFNTIDFSLKYKLKFLNKDIIVSNYINYNSVQEGISVIPQFNDRAFLRVFYEEFMMFIPLSNSFTLVGFTGMERVIGNKRTELATNGKAVDQTGYGYGLGLDIDISEKAGLYFRQRWYQHSDKNFVLDAFKGSDSNVELKIFF